MRTFVILQYSFALIPIIFTPIVASESFFKFMSLQDALTYNGEKIVYFSVGTHSEAITNDKIAVITYPETYRASRVWGRWQYLPTFMVNNIKKLPQLCACISIDSAWKQKEIKNIEEFFESQEITAIVKKHPTTIRIVSKDLAGKGAYSKVRSYLKNVLQKGGVAIIANFAPIWWSAEIGSLYNELTVTYPHSICFIVFEKLWSQGKKYSIYEEALMNPLVDPRINDDIVNDLMHHWKNGAEKITTTFSWDDIVKKHIRSAPFPYRAIQNNWSLNEDDDMDAVNKTALKALGYNPNNPLPDTQKFITDLLCESFSADFIPLDYLIEINTQNLQFKLVWNLQKATLKNITTFLPFTKYTEFPPEFVNAVASDIKRYKREVLTTNLHQLSDQFSAFVENIPD